MFALTRLKLPKNGSARVAPDAPRRKVRRLSKLDRGRKGRIICDSEARGRRREGSAGEGRASLGHASIAEGIRADEGFKELDEVKTSRFILAIERVEVTEVRVSLTAPEAVAPKLKD